MIRDITIGQFFPGESLLHRADPRMKIILSILYIVVIFMTNSLSGYIFLVLFTAALAIISRISFIVLLKAVKPLWFIILFTAVINIFWNKDGTLLVSFWKIEIYSAGLWNALFMMLRIVSLLIGTSVILTYTTSPIALTDAIERLLSPLKVIKVPVHEFAMMMSIALRFIPTLMEETDKIMSAQKARGADFTNGSLKQRAKALIPVLIPLFVSAFRRADELAVAMECRCYRGGEGRTRMTTLHLHFRDFALLFAVIAAGAAVTLLGRFIPIYKI